MAARKMTPEEEAEYLYRRDMEGDVKGALHMDEGPAMTDEIEFDEDGNPILKK